MCDLRLEGASLVVGHEVRNEWRAVQPAASTSSRRHRVLGAHRQALLARVRRTSKVRPMNDPKRIVADAYDRIAERYLEWRGRQPRQDELKRWLELVENNVRPGARVLDIGCGAGIPLTRALSEAFDVTGIDISTRQIELARANVPAARFILGDV